MALNTTTPMNLQHHCVEGQDTEPTPSSTFSQHAPETDGQCAGVQPHLDTVMSAPAAGSITTTFLKQTEKILQFSQTSDLTVQVINKDVHT